MGPDRSHVCWAGGWRDRRENWSQHWRDLSFKFHVDSHRVYVVQEQSRDRTLSETEPLFWL